jgi:hypothetical protein
VQMLKEMAAVLPKISMSAVKAKELGQLRAGEKEGDAALEARHHAFGNKIYNDSCLDEPRDERDQRDKQSGSRSERAETRGIATRYLPKRRAGEQRDRGRNCDDCVPRTTKQPKNESTKQTRVKPGFWRQIGEGRIAQTRGEEVCGERNAGKNIAAQPALVVGAQPAESWNHPGKGWRIHRGQSPTLLNGGPNDRGLFDAASCNL